MDRRQVSEACGRPGALEGVCGRLLDLPLPLVFPWVLADCRATVGVSPAFLAHPGATDPSLLWTADLRAHWGQVTHTSSFPSLQCSFLLAPWPGMWTAWHYV